MRKHIKSVKKFFSVKIVRFYISLSGLDFHRKRCPKSLHVVKELLQSGEGVSNFVLSTTTANNITEFPFWGKYSGFSP
jgi:hypothetical protein